MWFSTSVGGTGLSKVNLRKHSPKKNIEVFDLRLLLYIYRHDKLSVPTPYWNKNLQESQKQTHVDPKKFLRILARSCAKSWLSCAYSWLSCAFLRGLFFCFVMIFVLWWEQVTKNNKEGSIQLPWVLLSTTSPPHHFFPLEFARSWHGQSHALALLEFVKAKSINIAFWHIVQIIVCRQVLHHLIHFGSGPQVLVDQRFHQRRRRCCSSHLRAKPRWGGPVYRVKTRKWLVLVQ